MKFQRGFYYLEVNSKNPKEGCLPCFGDLPTPYWCKENASDAKFGTHRTLKIFLCVLVCEISNRLSVPNVGRIYGWMLIELTKVATLIVIDALL